MATKQMSKGGGKPRSAFDLRKGLSEMASLVIGLASFVATVLQFISTKRVGIWLLLGVLGLGMVAYAFRHLRREGLTPRDGDFALLLAVGGTVASLVAIAGTFGVFPKDAWSFQVSDSSADEGVVNPENGAATSPPNSPSTTPITTSPAPSSVQLPVSLQLNKTDDPLPRSVTVTVNRAADSGRRYWVLLRVAYSASSIEYYGQAAINVSPSQTQRVALQIPANADPEISRQAVVWAVPATVQKKLQDQQKQKVGNRDPLFTDDCPDCEAIDPVIVSKGEAS